MTWKYIAWELLTFPECNTMDAWAIDGMGWHFVLKHSICYASLSVLFGISNDVIYTRSTAQEKLLPKHFRVVPTDHLTP